MLRQVLHVAASHPRVDARGGTEDLAHRRPLLEAVRVDDPDRLVHQALGLVPGPVLGAQERELCHRMGLGDGQEHACPAPRVVQQLASAIRLTVES